MKRHFLKISMLSLATAVVLGLTACGGGGGGSSATSTAATSSSGSSSKGPFKEGSTVIAYKLNSDGTRDVNQTTLTTDGKGTFSFSSLGWSGPTEFVIYGDYLNENTGTYMTLPQADGISAVSNITAGSSASVNINVFTNIAAKSIIAKMAAGADIDTAKAEAETSVKELFNLNLDAGVSLEDLDPTDASQNTEANTQLLLVSSAILNTSNPEQVMQTLAKDMSDGEVDDAGLAALDEVKEEVTNVDLQQVAVNLEEADIGVTDAPASEDVLSGTLSFDHNMSFSASLDAYRDTEYTSNEVTVNGIIGESGAISVENGSYSIDGGPFVTTAATVANGQKVRVKTTSSADFSTTTTANLTIGGGVIPYTVTTMADPYVADTTPNEFSFGFKRDQAKFTSIKSEIITITGINESTPVSISGGDAKFSINGAAFGTSGNVVNNDTLQVQVTSGDAGTQTSVTVTVGDVNGTFNVFTIPLDTTPDAFTFADVVDINKTATPTVDSNSITITGINTAVPISVSGGEMNVDGVGFTTTATTINPNKTLVLRAVPSDNYETTTTVTVTVGNVIGTFNVTTMSDPFVADTTPNEFSFTTLLNQPIDTDVEANITVSGINSPTPVSITNGSYVVNGGSQDANVSNGDVITVTQHTATSFDTETVTTLTIGGVSGTFKTRTLQEDKIPDDFIFDANLSVPTSTEVFSNSITISGITAGTTLPISVENGFYDINGNGYTDAAGTVSLGDVVTLKQTSADTQGTSKSTTLTVGSTIRSFTTKTVVNAPAISGTPATTVAEDSTYIFEPTLDANSGEVETWSITNKPSWAIFNTLNGRLEGIPHNADVGTYSDINITATNAQGSASIVIASLEVINTNDAPVAQDINATTNEDTAVDINITSYVSDVDVGDTYSITALSTPSHGSVSDNGNIITYTPASNAFGTDSFTYTVADANGSTATATVHVVITPVNDAPVAVNDVATTPEDTNLTIPFATLLANDSDVDSNMTISITTASLNGGTTYISGDNVIYTPAPNFNGTDVFTYTVTDGSLSSDANVTVTVTPVNDAPVAGTFTPLTTIAQDSLYSFDVNVTDVDGDTLTYALVNNPSWMSINSVTGTVSGTPANADVGTVNDIQITVTDGNISAPEVIATFSVTVTNVNDAPIANDLNVSVVMNSTYNGLLSASDIDVGDTLTYTLVSSADANGTVDINATSGAFVYTPTTDFEGTAFFTYKATDANGTDSNEATVTLTVADRTITVVANDDNVSVAEDNNITIDALANDTATFDDNGDTATGTIISAISAPAHGTAVISNNKILYTPDANYAGADSFTYTANTSGYENNATVNVVVTPVDDAPVIEPIANVTVDEDSGIAVIDLNITDIDTNSSNLVVSAISSDSSTAMITDANLTAISITPQENKNGSVVITVLVSDGENNTSSQFDFTINPVNDAPVAYDTNVSVLMNSNDNTIDVLENISDVDNNKTELSILSCQDSNGSVVNNTTNISYTPATDFMGLDSFTCTVSDGDLNVTAPVNITVSGNHAPVVSDMTISMVKGETLSGHVIASDPDANDTLTYSLASASSELSGSTVSSDGNYTIVASDVGQGELIINVTDSGNGDVNNAITTPMTLTVQVIYSQSKGNGDISDGASITSAEFDTLATGTHDTIPADTKLYSVWTNYNQDTNSTEAEEEYLEFDSNGTFIVSDDNSTSYTHDGNLGGVTEVFMDDNGNNVNVADALMLDANMSDASIASEIPGLAMLHLPEGSVVYKMAVRMEQEEYDIWGPAQEDGTPYNNLNEMIDDNAEGVVAYNQNNNSRYIVFGDDQNLSNGSGTVKEIDVTEARIFGGAEPIIINENAGTWVTSSYLDDGENNVTIVMVTLNDGLSGYGESKYKVFVESGADINGNTTNVVYQGTYNPAGSSDIEYRFNDIANAAIQNYFNPVTIDEWITNVQDANNTELNATTFDNLGAGIVNPESIPTPLFELDFDRPHYTMPSVMTTYVHTFNTADKTLDINVTKDGVYDANESETLAYTLDTNNAVTLSRTVDGTSTAIYKMKIVGAIQGSDIANGIGLHVTDNATVYQIAGLQLEDEAFYWDENATAYDSNNQLYTDFNGTTAFINSVVDNNLSIDRRYDGTTNYALTLENSDNNISTGGAVVEVNLDTNDTTVVGSWEIISAIAGSTYEETLAIEITSTNWDQSTIAYGLNGGSTLLRGDMFKANTGRFFYLADATTAEFSVLNFENQLLLPFTYSELANELLYGVREDGGGHFVTQYEQYYNQSRRIEFATFDFDGSEATQRYVLVDGDIIIYGSDGSVAITIHRVARNDLYSTVEVSDGTDSWITRLYHDKDIAQFYANSVELSQL